MGIKNEFVIRRADYHDAGQIVGILNESFDSGDGQRRLGENITVSLFKVFINLENFIILVAEENKCIMGYICLQVSEFRFMSCLKSAPQQTMNLLLSVFLRGKFWKTILFFIRQGRHGPESVPYPKIFSLATTPKIRRRGAGSGLVAESLKCLSKEGIKNCFVLTAAGNINAVKFYKDIGFEVFKDIRSQIILNKRIGES